jgi:putative transposase
MMNPTAFANYYQALELSEAAIKQIQLIRSSEPVRRVQGRGNNVCARYPSRKMGRVIQAESRTVELVAIRCAYEFEPAVLGYWDQPCRLVLQYKAGNGRPVTINHTPDFFVLRQDDAGWEEWKAESRMEKLAAKMPNRYVRQPDGRWHCPPGEAAAAEYGFYYQVRTSAAFSATYQRNVAILEDYLVQNGAQAGKTTRQQIMAMVAARPGVSLAALQGYFTSDDLFSAIANNDIYTNLEAAPLVNADQVKLFASAATASMVTTATINNYHAEREQVARLAAGTILLWDERPWRVVNVGVERIAILSTEENGQLVELGRADMILLVAQKHISLPQAALSPTHTLVAERIHQASPAALERAVDRVRAVEALLAGQEAASHYAGRTLRRYRRRYLEGQAKYGSGLVGLLDDNHRKGNRRPRLSAESTALLEQSITESYETLKQKPVVHVYNEYVRACEAENIKPTSYTTFALRVKERPRAEQVRKRQGARAAYQTGPQNWWLSYDTPRHGDFPWQLAHIDHTQLNLEIVCATTGRVLGRPWLSVLLDAFSRRIPVVYLTFDLPSYRTCMVVLAECVHRYQRLPQQIIVDNGHEFRSTYFEALLAHYSVTKLSRPAAQPRAGSLIERLFRTSETALVHNLRGNTQMMKQARQVTKAVDPKNHAVWTLPDFYEQLCRWSYEVYDQMTHSTLGQSPREAYLEGLNAGGLRPNRQIAADETFRLLMLPTTKRGKAKVMAGRGVKVNYLYYWCDAFRQTAVIGTSVPVKYDPFDAGIAYAYVNGLWERCISERYAAFQGRSEREMMLATAILRQQMRLNRQQADINARSLSAFLASVEGQEALLEQQLKDSAARQMQPFMLDKRPDEPGDQLPVETIEASSTQRPVNIKTFEVYGDLVL